MSKIKNNILSFFVRFFGMENLEERVTIEEKRKYFVLLMTCTIGGFFLIFHGALAYFQGNKFVGFVNLLIVPVIAFLGLYLRNTLKIYPVAIIGTTVMFIHYNFLFINGVIEGSAFVWIYTFPPDQYFFAGVDCG